MTDRITRSLKFLSNAMDLVTSDRNPTEVIANLRERLQMLREELFAARDEIAALREEKLELAERLSQAARKELNLDRYGRVTLETGSVVYVEKRPDNEGNQKPVYFCARCFHEGRESILQIDKEEFHRDRYKCDTCGSTALVPNDKGMEIYTVPGGNDFRGY